MIITNHHPKRAVSLMYACHYGMGRVDYFYSLTEARHHSRVHGGWIAYPSCSEKPISDY